MVEDEPIGFYDSMCESCGSRYGWTGTISERPDICKTCGGQTVKPGQTNIKPDLSKPPPQDVKAEDVCIFFGKHKNKPLGQILVDEPSYLDWLNGIELNEVLKKAVKEMNEKYAKEIEEGVEQKQRRYYRDE